MSSVYALLHQLDRRGQPESDDSIEKRDPERCSFSVDCIRPTAVVVAVAAAAADDGDYVTSAAAAGR